MGTTQILRSRYDKRDLESQIARLNKIGIALSSEHDLNRLLNMIVLEARHFTRCDGGSLYIREGDKLNFIVAQTESLEKLNGKRLSFKSSYLPMTKESIAGYVAITGDILNIPDAYLIPPTVEYRLNKDFDDLFGYRTKSLLVVPMRDHEDEIIGVLQLLNSFDGMNEVVPFRSEYEMLIASLASQAAVAIQNAQLIEEIKMLFRSVVRYSAKAIDARSPHTAGHSGRVAKYSVRLMEAINDEKNGRFKKVCFTDEELEEMLMAGWLHDIGKIGVPEAVLDKENKLSTDHLEAVVNRFENIRLYEIARTERKKVEFALAEKLTEEKVKQIDKALAANISEIADDLAFVRRINVPGPFSDEDKQRLKAIAEKTFLDLEGEKHYYLTADEYENLSVARGNLTLAEYREIQSHVEKTLEILENIPFTKELQNIPRYAAVHHEMLDGSGYPRGLKGDEIPLCGRIMAVCDIYDALTASDRPYKKAMSIERSLAILQDEAQRGRLDSDLVDIFIEKKLYEKKSKSEDDEY
jgi:HD-GYP domain-containing protein (c-di-GMP phosphodiesterase class II)